MSQDRWYTGRLETLEDVREALRRLEEFLEDASGNLDGPGGGVTDGVPVRWDGTSGRKVKATDGELILVDGMTAPGTTAGEAKVYVDSADGDLKIKFGDGTVKTIVTDT